MAAEPQTCKNCAAWESVGTDNGKCRRCAPQPQIVGGIVATAIPPVWPLTKATDWCLEWSRK